MCSTTLFPALPLYLVLVFSSASSPQVSCQGQPGLPPPVTSGNSGSELSRLLEISKELASLNEKLRTELSSSKLSSLELARTLESSKAELALLRETLRGLEQSVRTSQGDSLELRTALGEAQTSLQNSEDSFRVYREKTEASILRLERSASRNRFFARLFAVIAVSGWAAFTITVIAD